MNDAILKSYEDCGTEMNFVYSEKKKLKQMTPMVLFLQCYNSYCRLGMLNLQLVEGTFLGWRTSRIHTSYSHGSDDAKRKQEALTRDEKVLLCARNCQEGSLLYSMVDFFLYFGE